MQDPIGLAGGNPTLYGYVGDTTTCIDTLGLSFTSIAAALNNAKDLAGIPRSQQFDRQWVKGDDITKKGADFKNYEYSDNPTHHGRYYEFTDAKGHKKVVVLHTNDLDQGLHAHAGKAPKGVDPTTYDFKKNKYGKIIDPKTGDHHIKISTCN